MILLTVLLSTAVSAEVLYASSYNDHSVTVLNLDSAKGSLTAASRNYDCGSEPTWLTLDHSKSVLYCLNEGWGGNASITSYKTNADGSLMTLNVLPVLKSPVASTLYGPSNSGLAVAYYDTSSFATFSVADAKKLALLHNETYTLAAPGPVADRQEAPHQHHSILDPTGKFLLSPDLGSDLIRLYKIDGTAIMALTPFKATAGSGPRHGAFSVQGGNTFFYTVNELSNSITGYSVAYKADAAPAFTKLFDVSTHGPGGSVPKGTKSAEIQVSPDQKFLIVSSRGENSLWIPNFTAGNTTQIPSDPLISFSIDGKSGGITLVQTASAGGRNPRGFTLNKAGTMVASALQDDNRVVVIARDTVTGKLGNIIASAMVGVGANNGPNYALFSE